MLLYEYEARNIASRYGVEVPRGEIAYFAKEAREIAEKLGVAVYVKAQVPRKGRGKVGGVRYAGSPAEAEREALDLLNRQIFGFDVQSVLVEEALDSKKELYFGITIDRSSRSYVILYSLEGGENVEDISKSAPEKIKRKLVDAIEGLQEHQARQIASELGYTGPQVVKLGALFFKLYRVAMDYDAELFESNPIIETTDGSFVATDPRIVLDDNALFRHSEFAARLKKDAKLRLSEYEAEALNAGLDYVKLDGDIGVVGNGAGLTMATLDMIRLFRGKPANFLDVGGGASSQKVVAALNVVMSDSRVKGVFINVLGGITKCDDVAKGVVRAKQWFEFAKPIVIRLVGTKEEEGRRILKRAGVQVFDSMEEAAESVVTLAK